VLIIFLLCVFTCMAFSVDTSDGVSPGSLNVIRRSSGGVSRGSSGAGHTGVEGRILSVIESQCKC